MPGPRASSLPGLATEERRMADKAATATTIERQHEAFAPFQDRLLAKMDGPA